LKSDKRFDALCEAVALVLESVPFDPKRSIDEQRRFDFRRSDLLVALRARPGSAKPKKARRKA